MSDIILKEESYKIIGIRMEVHAHLGMGFKVPFVREKQFKIEYKGIVLSHKYCADFIVFNSIILEVRSTNFIIDSFIAQTINYLKASGIKLGIIVNFGERSLTYKE